MSKRNDCWGLEVGANAIKAVRLVRKGDEIELVDFEVLPFKKILTTPDLNVNEAIQVNLDQFLSRHSASRSTVVVSVPGHMAFARFAKLPPVDPKRIPDIVRFEAVQQIPFPIEQVEWDYQVFNQPDSPDVEVGIFAITKDRVADFLENYNAVGLSVDGLTLSPLAVYNGLAYDLDLDAEAPGVIFMDIGATSTDVIIVEEGHLWLRTLPIGGNNFTDALVRAFKLSFPKAEKLKREAGTSKYARQIFQAMRPVFADLVQEMQRSLGFYQSLNRDAKINRLVGVGSTFRLPGMTKFLKQQLQIDVSRLDGFNRVKINAKQETEFAEHALNMATAYGLALQGLGLEKVSANILPQDLLRKRLWRSKQPWMGAAAAVMVAASGAAATRLWFDQQAYEADAERTKAKIQATTNRANGFIKQWNEIQTGSDPRQQIENLRRVLDYRDIWPKLLVDIELATLAMTPHMELMSADYDAIGKVERPRRRRVYINSIRANYIFKYDAATGEAGQPAPAAGSRAMTLDDIFGGGGGGPAPPPAPMGGPGMGGPGMGGPGMGGPGATGAGTQMAPPRFEIVVEGTTPYREPARLIADNFVRWLRTNADRKDRPYRIIADTPKLGDLEPVGASGRRSEETTTRPTRPMAPTPMRPTAPAVTRPGASRMGITMPGTGTTTTLTAEDATNFLPERPLADESAENDWRFTVSWTIELIRPEKARQAEDSKSAPAQPQTPAPAQLQTPAPAPSPSPGVNAAPNRTPLIQDRPAPPFARRQEEQS